MSLAGSSYQGSEAIGSDTGYNLRRYLLESDCVNESTTHLVPLVQLDANAAGLRQLAKLKCPKHPVVFSEIDSHQIYEMGSNVSGSTDGGREALGEPAAQGHTSQLSLPSASDFEPRRQTDENAQDLQPNVLVTNQALDAALSRLRPSLSKSIKLTAERPTFGISLGVLYQRDGFVVPPVVQYCIIVAEQVSRQTTKVYDLEASEDDINYLKDRFDNGRPVQLNAQAIYDQRTVDPRKLNFAKGDQILILEPKDGKWCLGRRREASGLLPIDFVQFSIQDIADVVATCKAFFLDLPNPLIPRLQYDSLVKAAGNHKSTLVWLFI